MKLCFHKQYIFTYGQSVEALGKQGSIAMIDRALFKRNNVFNATNGDPSLNIQCSNHDGAESTMQPMLRRGAKLVYKRFKEIQEFFLHTPKPPGLRPIKQVKLCKKFHPYVPHQSCEETCPKWSDEVLESVGKERADKRKMNNSNCTEKTSTKEIKKTDEAEKK
jgi:hypothetical protein